MFLILSLQRFLMFPASVDAMRSPVAKAAVIARLKDQEAACNNGARPKSKSVRLFLNQSPYGPCGPSPKCGPGWHTIAPQASQGPSMRPKLPGRWKAVGYADDPSQSPQDIPPADEPSQSSQDIPPADEPSQSSQDIPPEAAAKKVLDGLFDSNSDSEMGGLVDPEWQAWFQYCKKCLHNDIPVAVEDFESSRI